MAQAQLLYVGTTEGVAILSNPGRTDRWITAGLELPEQRIVAAVCDANAPMNVTVWSATAQFTSTDGGLQWQETPPDQAVPAPASSLIFPGAPPAAVRLTAAGVLERSDDAGASWSTVSIETAGSWTVIVAPAYHVDSAYLGSGSGEIWASTDRGRSWNRIKRDLPPITALAIGRVIS
jgi:photosystem II stability/assembly factor-like uncharacterized protein